MAAAAANDTTALIAAVRRDCFLATSDDNWTDARILGVADDCTLSYCAPALKRAKESWFRQDFVQSFITGQNAYDVPEEAMWSSIERAWLVAITGGGYYAPLSVVESSNRGLYQDTQNTQNGGVPTAMYFSHTEAIYVPAPSSAVASTYQAVISAYRRPAQLCLPSVTCRVTAVNSVTQTLTTTPQPTTWIADAPDIYTAAAPYRLDIYSRNLPNTRDLWSKTFTPISSVTLTCAPFLTIAEFAKINVGDYVTLKGQSPFPDLPPEGVPFLRKMIQKVIMTAQTDTQGLGPYMQGQAEEMALFLKGMGNRADGAPRKLSLANSASARFMRNQSRFRGR